MSERNTMILRQNMLTFRRTALAKHLAKAASLIDEIANDGHGLPNEIREAVDKLNNKTKEL